MTDQWVIYALADPRTHRVRYVGFTVNLHNRVRDHLKPSRLLKGKTRRDKWLNSLLMRGLRPVVIELEYGFGPSWAIVERQWIEHFRVDHADLTNHTDGGEGAIGRLHSEASKKAMSEKRKGRKPSPAAIAATIALHTGKKDSAEKIEARMAKVRGIPKSAEHRAKLSAALKGRKASDEARANQSAALRGMKRGPMSAEQKALLSRLKQGKPNPSKKRFWAELSKEQRAQIVAKGHETRRLARENRS